MLLIPCRGTIGNVVLAPEHFSNFALSDNALQIQIKNGLEGYIFIFLNTKYGRQLIRREISGAVIDLIDPPQISQVPIPIIKDEKKIKEINDLALKANELRSEAYYLEQDAIKQMNEKVIFAKK